MMMKIVTPMLAVCAIGGGGCGVDMDNGPAEGTGDGAVFQRTVVRLEADGTQTVHTERVTAEQQRREIAARQALADGHPPPSAPEAGLGTTSAAISVDGGCADTSMWMFDQPNLGQPNLGGNEICFTGCGMVDLSQYLRTICGPSFCFLLDWDGATRSFWAGADEGWFESANWQWQHFNPYERQNVVGPIVSDSRWLWLCN